MQILDRNRPRTMVFYGRVSTEQEAQLSALKNQIQWYDEQLQYHPNWNCINKYIDEGITGTQAKKRPSFLRMIEDAKKGEFDLIATREVSRFARNIVDTISYTRELKDKYNVEVYFIEDNIWTMDGDGELRLSIMATLAQEESRKTSERVKAGIKIARDNKVLFGNGNILGYNKIDNTYVINEEQAEVVRFIFNLYLDGYSGNQIRDELALKGYKTATGKDVWRSAQIINILHNPTYKGVMCYGRYYSDSYLNQNKIRNYDKSTYQYEDGNFPAIIEPEKWDKVQEIMRSKTQNTMEGTTHKGRGRRLSNDLWSKKLVCKCGSYMGRSAWGKPKKDGTKDYGYYCVKQKTEGTKKHREELGLSSEGFCDIPMIPEWKLHFMAKEIISYIWTNRIESVQRSYNKLLDVYEEEEKKKDNYSTKLNELHRIIDYNKEKIEGVIDLLAGKEITKEEYHAMRKKYDIKIEEKQKELNELEVLIRNQTEESKLNDDNKNSLKSLDDIMKTLEEAIDFSKPKLDDYIIDQLIYKIVPLGDNMYRWYVNISGNKPNPPIAADVKEEENIVPFITIGVEGNKRKHNLIDENGNEFNSLLELHSQERIQFISGLLIHTIILDYATTNAYRKLTGNKVFKRFWKHDIKIDIVIV